jgi:hypothetical protein
MGNEYREPADFCPRYLSKRFGLRMKPASRTRCFDSPSRFLAFNRARRDYGRKAAEGECYAEHYGIDAHYNQQRVHARLAP